MKLARSFLMVVSVCLLNSPASASEEVSEELGMPELAMVTGFRSLVHRPSGFEVRLLEADGSATVAWDPVALFVVVTNGTPDGQHRVWRLPRGVERVRDMSPTACGVDVRVEVDRIKDTLVAGRDQKILHLCFLSANRSLLEKLSLTELGPGTKRKAGQ